MLIFAFYCFRTRLICLACLIVCDVSVKTGYLTTYTIYCSLFTLLLEGVNIFFLYKFMWSLSFNDWLTCWVLYLNLHFSSFHYIPAWHFTHTNYFTIPVYVWCMHECCSVFVDVGEQLSMNPFSVSTVGSGNWAWAAWWAIVLAQAQHLYSLFQPMHHTFLWLLLLVFHSCVYQVIGICYCLNCGSIYLDPRYMPNEELF